MNSVERIKAMIDGKEIDRTAISFWKHFPLIDRDVDLFVEETIAFQEKFDLDFVKLSYNKFFSVEDWGLEIEWPKIEEGLGLGTVNKFAIEKEEDWESITVNPANEGAMARELEVTRRIVERYKGEVPVLATIFSPLYSALNMSGELVIDHVKKGSAGLEKGLETITETIVNFVKELIEIGVDGVFYATQLASFDMLDAAEYERFGKKYDAIVLEHLKDKTWFNILHVHGNDPMMDVMIDYPVQGISWHDRRVDHQMVDIRKKTDKILIGGIDEANVLVRSDEEIIMHAQEAISQVEQNKLILAPGCVLPVLIQDEKLLLLSSIAQKE